MKVNARLSSLCLFYYPTYLPHSLKKKIQVPRHCYSYDAFLVMLIYVRHACNMQYDTIQYNTIQYDTIRYNTIQYNTIQYDTIQYNTIRYNTIQYNTNLLSMWVNSFGSNMNTAKHQTSHKYT